MEDPTENFDDLAATVAMMTTEMLQRLDGLQAAEGGSIPADVFEAMAVLLMDGGARAGALERVRQVATEGFGSRHDDQHIAGDLVAASISYAQRARFQVVDTSAARARTAPPIQWPWATSWWKPSEDPKRNLEKAIALLMAEWSRLDRLQGKLTPR